MSDQERTLLQALKDMTAESSALDEFEAMVGPRVRRLAATVRSSVKKALTPTPPFDATAWAESIVKVRPGKFGRGAEVVIGRTIESWTSMTEANASAERIRDALIASLPEHLVTK